MLLFFLLITSINAFKFLIFSPATSKSHSISNGRIADELVGAGHDVILLELDILGISNVTESSKFAKKLVVNDLNTSPEYRRIMNGKAGNVMEERGLFKRLRQHIGYQQVYNSLCDDLLEKKELFDSLKNEKFDAIFAEQLNLCGFGYGRALGIQRMFLISSCPFFPKVYDFLGFQTPLSYVPLAGDLSMEPTYLERANSLFHGVGQIIASRFANYQLTSVFRKHFGEEFPSIIDIIRDVDVTFLSTDEIIDSPTITLPNIVHIGGLGVDQNYKAMGGAFQREMSKGEQGVILFSLGTVVNTTTLDARMIASLLSVVKKFPDYHFIIKVDKYDKITRERASGMNNVFLCNWMPQSAILHHPRLRTFITHAGYNGVMEAVLAGVPLITIPFMFDQNQNSRAIEKKGWGIRRHKEQLLTDPDSIETAIREMLENPKYTEEAHRIRDLIKSKPMGARERFIKTTEWVIQNGGVRELLTESRNLGVIKFYNLDVILPIFFVFLLALFYIIPTIGGWYYYSCFGHIKEKSRGKSKKE